MASKAKTAAAVTKYHPFDESKLRPIHTAIDSGSVHHTRTNERGRRSLPHLCSASCRCLCLACTAIAPCCNAISHLTDARPPASFCRLQTVQAGFQAAARRRSEARPDSRAADAAGAVPRLHARGGGGARAAQDSAAADRTRLHNLPHAAARLPRARRLSVTHTDARSRSQPALTLTLAPLPLSSLPSAGTRLCAPNSLGVEFQDRPDSIRLFLHSFFS